MLRNRYFAFRHGQSEANVVGIIVSDPVKGAGENFGLTGIGRIQVFNSVRQVQMDGLLDRQTIVYSSDFSRAKETAEIAKDILRAHGVFPEDRLRERYFGEFEGTSNSNYQKIWDCDEKDFRHQEFGVESAWKVYLRTTSLVLDLELTHCGKKFLLVSHGDTLQILQTFFVEQPVARHRSLAHLETAEIRELVFRPVF